MQFSTIIFILKTLLEWHMSTTFNQNDTCSKRIRRSALEDRRTNRRQLQRLGISICGHHNLVKATVQKNWNPLTHNYWSFLKVRFLFSSLFCPWNDFATSIGVANCPSSVDCMHITSKRHAYGPSRIIICKKTNILSLFILFSKFQIPGYSYSWQVSLAVQPICLVLFGCLIVVGVFFLVNDETFIPWAEVLPCTAIWQVIKGNGTDVRWTYFLIPNKQTKKIKI